MGENDKKITKGKATEKIHKQKRHEEKVVNCNKRVIFIKQI